MNIQERVKALRKKMEENGISAYLIPSSDPHQNEYLPQNYKTREYISGFTGSAGSVIVTKDKAGLWTDGRYFLQAEKQLAGSGIELYKMAVKGFPTVNEFLQEELKNGGKLGLDGKVVSVRMYEGLKNALPSVEIISDKDLVGEIWTDRPEAVQSEAFLHAEKYTGKSTKDKIAEVRSTMAKKGIDSTVIGALEDVCYVYNVRAKDIECNPVLTSYAIIDQNRATLFVAKKQINAEVEANLKSAGVEIMGYDEVFAEAEKLSGTIYIDPTRTNIYLYNKLKGNVIQGLNITSSMKAIKNETEIKGFDKCMEQDGAALVKMLKWAEEHADKGVTECDLSDQLEKFREEGADFVEISFDTIAGYGPNGAVVHYKPERGEDATIEAKSFLLVDSGGQYYNGTTDVTRTIPMGPLTEEEKINYTRVLKAHAGLARAKFKAGTTGNALDTIARTPFWEQGMDYGHGTGHGVGYFLAVHEGPQSISSRVINVPMEIGMITSNEPGIYIAGKHGIRIESLVVTEKFKSNEYGDFYQFRTITLCPIDTRPIVPGILAQEDIDWLNAYHKEVRERLSPYLDEEHKKFLEEKTKAI